MKAQLFLLALVGMFLTERFPVASKVCAVIVVLVIGEKVVWFVQHRRRFARLVHSHGQICMVWLYLTFPSLVPHIRLSLDISNF